MKKIILNSWYFAQIGGYMCRYDGYPIMLSREESAVLGQSSFFKKYERKNLEFFTWSLENDFSNLCPSLIEKIRFPFFF